jgi:polyhydroxyalkanoate synthase
LIRPSENDRRFTGPDWELPSFNFLAQAFLLTEQWWHSTTTDIHGLAHSNAAIADFALRQCLDTVASTNFVASNPKVLRKIIETGGGNFVSGLHNWIEDWQALLAGGRLRSDQQFAVGKDVAVTPGKVVYRNELIELIQYAPTTQTVRPEPVLIVPAWIMKYYILDLSPHNSLVRFLVEKGFTVFMVSWKNPTPDYRDLSLEDYRHLGVDAAIAAINETMPGRRIHAAGYCLGGTLLSIAAARLGRERPDCLRSVTLLAAQTDFTEAGELTLFINESQVAFLEDIIWRRGLLGTSQMAGAFQMLRTNDLLWSRLVRDYLIGERAAPSDLMSWNADATRMPYRMHSDYLRRLFLNNDLAEGRYLVDGEPVTLSDLQMPMFVIGTQRDHVAPWKSTYKIHLLANADVTYVLTSGGHNAGIVAPPGEEGHSYQVLTKKPMILMSPPTSGSSARRPMKVHGGPSGQRSWLHIPVSPSRRCRCVGYPWATHLARTSSSSETVSIRQHWSLRKPPSCLLGRRAAFRPSPREDEQIEADANPVASLAQTLSEA